MDDDLPEKKCPAGSPAWVMTFADLMSLLMCFFVLLLSFAEMDVLKFKQIAGSMKFAFGVQSVIEAKSIPKGTSIIAQEFSPGKPEPTVIQDIQQSTIDEWKENLEAKENQAESDSDQESQAAAVGEQESDGEADAQSQQFLKIQAALAEEISQGLLDVEVKEGKTIIRIEEKGSFPSGTADLNESFAPIMQKISDLLLTTEGKIHVAGHTDNVPISTKRYRSNWELSSARSVTVLHHLLRFNSLDQKRFTIEGMADASPLEANDTREGRAKNRRVEVIIEEE